MRKGETTRLAILDHAVTLARQIGLGDLTIGRLASELHLSKSGLFAHFRSKEALQVQVLEAAAARFVDLVVKPALAVRRGELRVRALFDRWVDWEGPAHSKGGCIFLQAAAELDDQDGPPRARLVQLQRDWLDFVADTVRGAIAERHFGAGVDPEQFAHDFQGIILSYQHASRLLRDGRAEQRARTALEALIVAARPARRARQK